jgi:hypothetical protein
LTNANLKVYLKAVMKRLARMALDTLRVSVVIGALLALTISGAGAAQRIFAEEMSPQAAETAPSGAAFDSKPNPDEATGGMETRSRPSTEQSFWIQGNPALPVGGDQSHRLVSTSAAGETIRTSQIHRGDTVRHSAGQVATQVGHRFTLVGARPSGTS